VGRIDVADGFPGWSMVRAAYEAEAEAAVDVVARRKEVEMVRPSAEREPAVHVLACG